MSSIWNTLSNMNRRLETDIQELLRLISEIDVATEFSEYHKRLTTLFNQLSGIVQTNQIYLGLKDTTTLDDIVSNTQVVNYYISLANQYLATPMARFSESDRLCLFFIRWLHQQHNNTGQFPAAFIDGDPAIVPFIKFPPTPIYAFPFSKQKSLLYLPLLFHEFGHLLYAVHEPEMKSLVEELQRKISIRLTPLSQRNDGFAREQTHNRQVIVNTWYKWIQELFCDAVGFVIGGPCYIYAFSAYLASVDETGFYRKPEQLKQSEHPVTWLRVKLLLDRSQASGYDVLSENVRHEWKTIANLLNIKEDYHGYYIQSLKDDIMHTIDDMLIEVSPRTHTCSEATVDSWSPDNDTPIQLLNWAWRIVQCNPEHYIEWEKQQVNNLLQ